MVALIIISHYKKYLHFQYVIECNSTLVNYSACLNNMHALLEKKPTNCTNITQNCVSKVTHILVLLTLILPAYFSYYKCHCYIQFVCNFWLTKRGCRCNYSIVDFISALAQCSKDKEGGMSQRAVKNACKCPSVAHYFDTFKMIRSLTRFNLYWTDF